LTAADRLYLIRVMPAQGYEKSSLATASNIAWRFFAPNRNKET
jgi:hypothetical protein